jgi:hypothetical protein
MRVLCIVDVKNWVFDKTAKVLQQYGKNQYVTRYRGVKYKQAFKDLSSFDLILYFVDIRPDHIMKYRPPKEKTIMMIRSDVFKLCAKGRNQFYKSAEIAKDYCAAFMVANKYLLNKFEKIHSIPCYHAPGGVDTELFYKTHSEYYWDIHPTVGWSGSVKYFGPKLRGLKLIEEACKRGGYEWNPAIKEKFNRTQWEMAEYYNQEINVYVDASSTAGRQNGLLEAAACGLPLVCTETGIGRELIDAGCAIKINRTVESIMTGINMAWNNRTERAKKAEKYVREFYDWKDHVTKWEDIFAEIKSSS